MIPYGMVASYGATLDQLSTAAIGELSGLLAATADLPDDTRQLVLFEAFPELFGPYAMATSEVSATFYEEVRQAAEFRGRFDAEVLGDVDAGRLNALVGWATSPAMMEQSASLLSLLSGGLVSILSEHAADTVIGNAALDDRNKVRYQRVPRSGCCAFCGMLASRGGAYKSREAAAGVVGRGMPVEATRGKRGGQAKGIKPRGSRTMGQAFHDFCRCRAVPVNEGNTVQLQADAGDYYDTYRRAADRVSSGQQWIPAERGDDGQRITKGHWIDAEGNARSDDEKRAQILAFMRADLGVK
jgi:hypothetical protein